MRINRQLFNQIVLFGIVGVITLLIDLAVTIVLYNVFHLPAYLSSGIGFLSGFVFNFPMNRKRVFRHTKNDRFNVQPQVILYACLCLINLVVSSLLVEGIVSLNLVTIGYAKMFVTIIIAVWNFIIFKYVVFSKKPEVPANLKV